MGERRESPLRTKRLEWIEAREERAALNDAIVAITILVAFFAFVIWIVYMGVSWIL